MIRSDYIILKQSVGVIEGFRGGGGGGGVGGGGGGRRVSTLNLVKKGRNNRRPHF